MIPFLDLKAQYAGIKTEIDAAVLGVLDTAQFVLGEEVAAFEAEFAAYCGAKHAIAVNTGTSALHLALLAAGVGPGDEVITVPFTFVATVSAICYTGARPVFVDIEPDHVHDGPGAARGGDHAAHQGDRAGSSLRPDGRHGRDHGDRRAPRTRGHRRRLPGARRRVSTAGAPAASASRAASASIPGKNLGAYGEGGIVVTSDDDQAQTMRMLRDWGQEKRYHHVLKGFNYRMDGIQGAILRVKLRHLERWTEARRATRGGIRRLLAGSRHVATPVEVPAAVTSITSMRCAPPTATDSSGRFRPKASRPGCTIRFRSTCRRRIGTLATKGDFPSLGSRGERGALAADVSRNDRSASRAGRRRGGAGGLCRLIRSARPRIVTAVHGRREVDGRSGVRDRARCDG